MSKKKSYMDSSNLINEGAIRNFLKGLFRGKEKLKSDVVRHKRALEKNIKNYNAATEKFEKAFEKQFGKKVKFEKETIEDFIEKAKLR
jgi:hypothetical protein